MQISREADIEKVCLRTGKISLYYDMNQEAAIIYVSEPEYGEESVSVKFVFFIPLIVSKGETILFTTLYIIYALTSLEEGGYQRNNCFSCNRVNTDSINHNRVWLGFILEKGSIDS